MYLLTILVLIILLVYLLHNNISISSILKKNFKEDFLVAIKDKQKIGTNELEDGQQPKSSFRSGSVNYESCYSTETRNGNSTGRQGNFFCNQGIDGGEVIPAEGLYSLEFSNYTIHPGKALKGQRLNGNFRMNNGKTYTFTEGLVNGETLTLAQSKTIADSLAEKVHGFIMVIPTKNSSIGTRTVFISKKEDGWEDPDTYIKMQDSDETNTNIVSYVKKELYAVEKSVNQAKINEISNKYKNLPTCNWKSANRCIFKDYVYNQSNGTCVSKDNLSYNIDQIRSYDEISLSEWLKSIYNRDMGPDKLSSEATNVFNYIERCKDVEGYEFLSNTALTNPYIPTKNPGDVKGRYVRITINNRDVNQNWLQLAEVQVISNNRNIAINKLSNSSGNYPGSTNSKANDGNNDGNWSNGSVYISGNGSWNSEGSPQFWEVDLGDASQTIDRIIISNRTECCRERLNNWLLSIYDYNKNLIWARIFPNHPNPKFTIDIKASDNDMKNIKIKDYDKNRFNKYFYRVSDTEYNSKTGWTSECAEDCHRNVCQGENKKWIGNNNWYGCREYKPGEKEAEEAEKRRIEEQKRKEEEERKRNESAKVVFSARFFHGQPPSDAVERQWTEFRRKLTGNYDTMEVYNDLGARLKVTDPKVNQLAQNLRNGTHGFRVDIGGKTWRVLRGCVQHHKVSVNDQIYLTTDPWDCSCGTSGMWTIRPMIVNLNWGGLNSSSCWQQTQTITLEFYTSKDNCSAPVSVNNEGKILYGPWIRNARPMTHSSLTSSGEKVYMTHDDRYIKMVTQSGEGRYHLTSRQDVSEYKPCDWDKYSKAPQGVYLLR